MSKNTGTSELINYFDLGVNGDVGISGNLTLDTITNATTNTDTFLVSDTGIIKYRTGAQLLSDIGAAPATGGSYLPLAGGTLTGTLNGTSTIFSSDIQSNTRLISSNGGQAIFITANSGGLTNRIEATSGLPLHIVTTGSSLSLAAGGTTPQFTLASTGAATFTSTISATGTIRTDGASNGLLLRNGFTAEIVNPNTNTRDIQFNQDTNATVMFKGNGNVGIGTASPLGPLEVRAANRAVSSDGILQVNTTNSQAIDLGGSLSFGGMYQNSGTTPTEWAGISGRKENSTNNNYAGYLSLGTRPMGGVITERLRITSGGNVLIGTTTDNGGRLQINGIAAFTSTSVGTGSQRWIGSDGSSGLFLNTPAGSNLNLGVNNTPALTIASTGAATFSGNLSVFSSAYDNNAEGLRFGFSNSFYNAIKAVFTSTASSNKMTFVVNNGIGTRGDVMTLVGNGNVGIGTASPSAALDIQFGSSSSDNQFRIRKSDTLTTFLVRGDGAVFASGIYGFTTGSAANVVVFSDGSLQRSTSSIKYKKNIENYSKGLEEVMLLRPVTYEGISESDKGKIYAGLIAEEVHDLGLTEFVQYAEDGSPDALSYSNMISLLVKAIQEQQVQIDKLKNS